MSWFEATAFASIAKNAFKEAQKKIDEALDIREEENINDYIISSSKPSLSNKLKQESENFFANFGVTEKAVDDSDKSEEKINDNVENSDSDIKNEGAIKGRMVGSLWGSFTGSFFENPKVETKELAGSTKSSSAPVTPSDQVVATQPPRSISNLPESSTELPVEDSSNSSSIVQISSETLSPATLHSQESPFLEEINVPSMSGDFSADTVTKEGEWEWGWDNSIIVMSSSSAKQNEEGPILTKSDSFTQEESLADDSVDADGFAKSRLIVGSVDSESSSNRRESLGSVYSNRSQSEVDSLAPVVEEVFTETDHSVPSLYISLPEHTPEKHPIYTEKDEARNTSEGKTPELVPQDHGIESPDSIVVLDSNIASPVEQSPSVDSESKICPHILQFESNLSSPESIEVISHAETPNSQSSIEVLSGTSTEISSPTTQESSSHTLSEDVTESTCSKGSSSESEESKNLATSKFQEKPWKVSQEEPESQAITKQPISRVVKGIHQEEGISINQGTEILGMLSEEAKESFHSSTTTSSSTLTVVDVGDSGEDVSSILGNDSQVNDLHERLLSMNAGEIRKNLEVVDKDVRTDGKICSPGTNAKSQEEVSEGNVKKEDELSGNDVSQASTTLLEMSSRSESSTETVTASMDSQHMVWSDTGLTETPLEVSEISIAKSKDEEEETEVKDMLEDAMEEGGSQQESQTEKREPDQTEVQTFGSYNEQAETSSIERELSPSSSERSDALKVSSSGQSSGDEVETATSSDIEVISSPSIDGSSNSNSRSSMSIHSSVANKSWLSGQRGLRTFISERTDVISSLSPHSANNSTKKDSNGNGETVPSSMTTSFTSISESEGDSPHMPHSELLQLEASRLTHILLQDLDAREKGHRRNKSNMSETSESSSEPQTPEVEKLIKKITYLTEVLESRETKVLELSHLNTSLQDANVTMKSRIEELEGLRRGNENTENLREEYTQRMVVMERKFQQALREKENAKKQLEEYKAEVASRRNNADVMREIEEKDIIISELRREGEKLSKQQLTYSNTIKKLRAKEKDSDSLIKDQKEKIESLSVEIERLRKSLKAKDEVERRQIDAVRQLTVANQRQEEEAKNLRAENSELEGKLSALKEALDSAYKEMNELQRCAASKDAEVQKAALSAEVLAREKVESALTSAQKQNKKEQDGLMAQIHELQDALSQAESQYNRKERQLRGEIKDLLERLSEAESRTDEISNSVTAATRPLLRQMENLQATQLAQQTAWETMEESLTKRLNEAQNSALSSSKKEREVKEQLSSAMSEITSLQSKLSSYQSENAQLKSKLEVITAKASSLEEAKNKESSQLEALKNSFAEEISEVKHERDILEQQLEIEKTAVNAEKRKSASYLEQLKEKDRKMAQLQVMGAHASNAPSGESRLSTPRSSPTPSLSRLSLSGSVNDSFAGSHWGDDVFETMWVGGRSGSLYDSLRGNSAATVDALTSALRQREGEVHHLQSEVTRLEAQKESLAQELVHSSRQSEDFASKVGELEELQKKQRDIEQKYNALLQMYGEKVEEVDELRLDLEDVKEMYKLQIDQLMQK